MMLYLLRGRVPLTYHWTLCIVIPLVVVANQATFDIEKSLSLACDRHCYNGVCLNGSCVCAKGWAGPQCDHCYGRIRLNENQSMLSDGPQNYTNSAKCTWVIESEKKTSGPLNIRIENFHTECGWDYLYVYDGDGVHGQQLAALCGDQPQRDISVPSGKALVYFFSDLAQTMNGFNITYEFGACPHNCSNNGHCKNSACVCDSGYTGESCDIRICSTGDDGAQGPCARGVCQYGKCICPTGFHGSRCEKDSSSAVWSRILSRTEITKRASHATVMVDDAMWVIGGEHFSGVLLDDVSVFNTTSEAWTPIAVDGEQRPLQRFDHTLVRYKNKLFMFGGVVKRKNITAELWSFDMHTRKWNLESKGNTTTLSKAPLGVAGHSAHVIGSEMYVFFGYNDDIGFTHQVQIYDFDSGEWRFGKTKDHVYGRFKHASVHYKSDKGDMVLVYGGAMWSNMQNNNLTDSLMMYDVKMEKWSNLPASGNEVFLHTATLLNGLMVIVGGNAHKFVDSRSGDSQECFSSLVLAYDIACKQWFNLTTMPIDARRYGHSTVSNADELFVFGGFDGRMRNDVWKMTPAECSSATRPEECRSLSDGIKCVFTERSCIKMDPYASYKQPFQSFVKGDSQKEHIDCPNTPLRQALQICEEIADCISCASQSGCGWCPSGDQCLPNDSDCVDGQVMLTAWEKCPSAKDKPVPRPCSMSNDCISCRLLSHCNWFSVDHKPQCISLEEEAVLVAEQHSRDNERFHSSGLSIRHQTIPSHPALQILQSHNISQCPAPCSALSECSDCISHSRCMWCPTVDRCINMEAYTLSFAYGQCQSWITANTPGGFQKTCAHESSNCTSHKTCAECQLSPQCGWLDDGSGTGLGSCLKGTNSGPLLPQNTVQQKWYFIDCPACQCNGHSKCDRSISTLGGVHEVCGICSNNTTGKHCEVCAPGFHGDPRNGGICSPCECHGQADECDPRSGHCHCRTKGVIGKFCDKCDAKYFGSPRNGTPCFYELTVDFIFTFKLKKEDKDKHATEIFLFSIPYKRDTDVTFQINCDPPAFVALNETSSNFIGQQTKTRRLMTNTYCDLRGFRRIYSASDTEGWTFGTDANTTFFVRVYNFSTPVTIQVSFAQSPPINWVLFFVIFAACFIVLLVVAGLLWMVKLRIEVYRRNQRRMNEIENMASRPFANVKLELSTPHLAAVYEKNHPTPLSVEPCSNYKAGVFTVAVRLPTGGRATTPNGTSGLAVASALCQLTPAQLGVLHAPDNNENKNGRKANVIRRYIPFLRSREVDSS